MRITTLDQNRLSRAKSGNGIEKGAQDCERRAVGGRQKGATPCGSMGYRWSSREQEPLVHGLVSTSLPV